MRRALVLLAALWAWSCRQECSQSLVARVQKEQRAPETWFLDFGTEDSHANLVSGWSGDQRWPDSGETFVWSTANASVVQMNRYGTIPVRLRFRCAATADQEVTILVNGHSIANVKLSPAFTIHDLQLPALAIGKSRVEFRYGNPSRVAWDWLEILEPRAMPNGREPRLAGDAVFMPYRAAVHYRLDLAPDDALVADAVTVDGEVPADDRGRIQVTLRSPGGSARTTIDIPTDGMRIELPVEKAQRFDVELVVLEPRSGSASATGIRLRKLRVVRQCR